MDSIMTGALFTCMIASLFCMFMLWRNEWVYSNRISILYTQPHIEYKKLCDYNVILWKFWIWDIEKFKKEN